DGRVFGARIPVRAHGCALDPRDPQRAIFFARRPGTQAFVLDLASPRARLAFETTAGRHFAGHGVFSTDGTLLYTPEHDYERKRGVLGVRDARDFRLVGEIETQGLDPHDIAWLPGHGRLLVANGGILTHPRTFRRKLNIDTMDPSLCAIDAASGECLEQWRLEDHQLSIRHLSVASDGTAAVGLQYEGARSPKPSVVALYRPQRGLTLLEAPSEALASMAGYVASVCVSDAHDLVAASCPYGKGIVCWTRQGVFRGVVPAAEAYGLSRLADGSVYVSQRDGSAPSPEQNAPAKAMRIASCGLAALCFSNLALAQLPDWAPKPPPRVHEDVVRAEVLVLGAGFDTTLRVDESLTEQGTEINAEDDLGLDDSKIL